jgi:hypothetical protein
MPERDWRLRIHDITDAIVALHYPDMCENADLLVQ